MIVEMETRFFIGPAGTPLFHTKISALGASRIATTGRIQEFITEVPIALLTFETLAFFNQAESRKRNEVR
jgi:hypothetical protein